MSNGEPLSPSDMNANPPAGAPTGWLARVERVYFEVVSLAPKDREEAIVRLSEGDEAIGREVRALMESAAQLGSFLGQPALGKHFDQLDSDSRRLEASDGLIGTTLGSYKIQSRVASGGMGTVYAAARSDGQFEQRVAVKVVKRGMDSEEILRRFKTERETLAALDHPNIARLIDGGITPDGRPFVVMEFVEGKPLDAYCDGKGLGLRERLMLFRQVCAGVHHAHQNLVIHRDIKPSNILVTAAGVPKLLDFGIAKVLSGGTTREQAITTIDADRRLTPEYASPEQVEGGGLTTASDVYSLGIVLYELLTGTRPYQFATKTSDEIRRVICTQPPLPPSAAVTVRASRVRGTQGSKIAETTADPAPDGPAETQGGATSPIRTSGATASQTTSVDVPKTRGMSSTRLRGLLRGDLDVIVLMALRKEPVRRYASVEQFSADIERFLSNMPVNARKDTLGYRASKFVRRHAIAVTMAAAAFALLSAATTLLYRQGQQLRKQRLELVETNTRLDENLKRVTESRRFLQAVLGGADTGNHGPEATLGDVLKEAVATLKTSPPTEPFTHATAELEVGRSMMSLGMLEDARPLLEDADRLYAGLPADSDLRMDSALSLGELAFHSEDFPGAERRFRELLAKERGKGAPTPTERESAILNNLGSTLRKMKRLDESVMIQREALQATIATLGEGSLAAAETRNNLASSLFDQKNFAEAEREFAAAYAARQRLLRPGHPLLVRCQSNLGLAKLRNGHVEEAITLLSEASSGWEKAFGPEHPGRVPASIALSQSLRKASRQAEALDCLRNTLAWQSAHQPGAVLAIASTEANIGITLSEMRRDREAMEILGRVLPLLRNESTMAGITRSATEELAALCERAGDESRAKSLRDSLPNR